MKQYLQPYNTLNIINYSVTQFTLDPRKRSKLHKLPLSEIYYVLEASAKLNVDEETFQLKKR